MSEQLDNLLQDWHRQLNPSPGRRARTYNIKSASCYSSNTSDSGRSISSSAIRHKMKLTVQRTPEVMVKISGGGKNMKHIKAHMDYISRHGTLALEDEQGFAYQDRDDLRDIQQIWSRGRIGIPDISERRKEAFNIVLSMPPGTDRDSVRMEAREFASNQFKDHQYVYVAHNDEKHPHIHLCVKAISCHGRRLNPRKGDLQHWREQFAEQLRAQGIEANATSRQARGVVRKPDKQVILHIDAEFATGQRLQPSLVSQAAEQQAKQDLQDTKSINTKLIDHQQSNKQVQVIQPTKQNMTERRALQQAYGNMARTLASGDKTEQQLALDIVQFLKTMPPPLTRHEYLMQSLKAELPLNRQLNQEPGHLER